MAKGSKVQPVKQEKVKIQVDVQPSQPTRITSVNPHTSGSVKVTNEATGITRMMSRKSAERLEKKNPEKYKIAR